MADYSPSQSFLFATWQCKDFIETRPIKSAVFFIYKEFVDHIKPENFTLSSSLGIVLVPGAFVDK